MLSLTWSIKEIVEILKSRQLNEFDGNIAVTGDRGNGKSTLINKIFYRFKKFRPWNHQVYSREDVVKLLKTQQYNLCWDDEAINTGYKRDFQQKAQQELIKILTAYRDNFNIFASAIPNFFSLDKDFRDLYFLHLFVIERGLAIVHMPLQGRLYSQDRWDSKYNATIEASWSKRMKKDPNFRPPYHRLTTFKGYLYFGDVTEKQKILYEHIKKTKRSISFLTESEKTAELSFIQKVYKTLMEGKLTKEGLLNVCLIEGKKYNAISSALNQMLTDNGIRDTLSQRFLIVSDKTKINNRTKDQIDDLIPSF